MEEVVFKLVAVGQGTVGGEGREGRVLADGPAWAKSRGQEGVGHTDEAASS